MPENIRMLMQKPQTWSDHGDGAAIKTGYGAGGLGGGEDRAVAASSGGETADHWDAPGVSPDGRRTGSCTDGPRIASAEESEPDPDDVG
jgi:hypothetical protein